MADRIKGITIEIDGDTTGLSKALKGVNSDLKTAQSGLNDVNKLLKLDPGNVELLRQKQGYLNDAIGATEEKLQKEKEALEQMKNSDGFDKNSEQAKALERQIAADEQALKSLQDQSKEFGSVFKQEIRLSRSFAAPRITRASSCPVNTMLAISPKGGRLCICRS